MSEETGAKETIDSRSAASETVDLRVENASLLTPAGLVTGDNGVAIDGETIIAVGRTDSLPPARRTIDCEGSIVAPGIVDEHVHDRSLGQTHKEDWETLTRSAAAGGVTTVLGHGNTDPFVERPGDVARKLDLAAADAVVDFGCFAWVTDENYDRLGPLAAAGAVGFQASLAERPLDSGELLVAMENCVSTGRRFGVHVEDGAILDSQRAAIEASGGETAIDHCRGRPPVAELVGAGTVVELARETGCPLHVFQVSAGATLDPLVRAKQDGLDVTVETCPHYLRFTEAEMERQGSVAVVSPPLRAEAERERLWNVGIDGGSGDGGAVDCIGTDHAPHTDAEKRIDDQFEPVRGVSHGFVGLETAVPMLLTFAARGRLSYTEWIRLHSEMPARAWGLYPEKGSLDVGTDADIVIVDQDREWTFDSANLRSKGTVTPFDGERFRGAVIATIVRGEVVYEGGTVVGDPGWGSRVEPE
jgi:dihydroorotase/allantoinase